MSSAVRERSAKTGQFAVSKGKSRLIDSITGSLRVEGYAVKHQTVVQAIEKRKK